MFSYVVHKKDDWSPSRTAPQLPICSNLALHNTANNWLNWRGIGGTTIGHATRQQQTTQENTCDSIPEVSMSKLRNSRNTLCHCVSQVRLQEDYDGLGWHQGFTSYMFNLAASLHIEFVIYCFTSTHFYLPTHQQHSSATCLECSVSTSDTITHHFLMDKCEQSFVQFYNNAIFELFTQFGA